GAGSFPGNFPGAIRNDTNVTATINNAVVLQSDTLIHVQGAASGNTILSGNVSGPGALTLTAPNSNTDLGTLVLGGTNNSYAGATNVNGGTLSVTGAITGTGPVTVSAAGGTNQVGTLAGTGDRKKLV